MLVGTTVSTIDVVSVGSTVITTSGEEVVSITATVDDGGTLEDSSVGGALEGVAAGMSEGGLDGTLELVVVDSSAPPAPPPPPPPPTGGTTGTPPTTGTMTGTIGTYEFPLPSVVVYGAVEYEVE